MARPSSAMAAVRAARDPASSCADNPAANKHYHPLDHWGGDEGLVDRQAMDARKRAACAEAGITLVEWRFDEPISEAAVRERLGHLAADSSSS